MVVLYLMAILSQASQGFPTGALLPQDQAALGLWEEILAEGDAEKIEKDGNRLANSASYSALALAQMGILAYEAGFFAVSIPFFERLLASDPQSADLHFNVALAQIGAGQLQKAKTQLQTLVSKTPSAESYHLLGTVLDQLEERDAALESFQKATQLDPIHPDYQLEIGLWYLRNSQSQQAVEFFETLSRQFPESERLRLAHGTAQILNQQQVDGMGTLLETVEEFPASKKGYLLLAQSALLSKRFPPTLADRMEQFSARWPQDPLSHYYQAKVLYQMDLEEASLDDLSSLVKRSLSLKNLPESHFLLAQLLEQQGDLAEAVEHFRESLRLDPEQSQAHYRLAQIYREQGDLEKARSALEQFEQLKEAEVSKTNLIRTLSLP